MVLDGIELIQMPQNLPNFFLYIPYAVSCGAKKFNLTIISFYCNFHFSTKYPTFHKCNKTQITKKNLNRCWDSVGMNFGIVAIMCSHSFLFGTEIRKFQINPEGWLVGVWDGDSWDPSQRFRGL